MESGWVAISSHGCGHRNHAYSILNISSVKNNFCNNDDWLNETFSKGLT